MKIERSYNIQIYVGLREGYTDTIHTVNDVQLICSNFVNQNKDCVTITPTEFWYVDGWEPGVIVGFINYPRFPRTPDVLIKQALTLGEILRRELKQNRISVVTPDFTYLLDDE